MVSEQDFQNTFAGFQRALASLETWKTKYQDIDPETATAGDVVKLSDRLASLRSQLPGWRHTAHALESEAYDFMMNHDKKAGQARLGEIADMKALVRDMESISDFLEKKYKELDSAYKQRNQPATPEPGRSNLSPSGMIGR